MTRQTFRAIDEKHLATEADLMLWSPKMDLIAIANVHGEVALNRLTWKKVWSLSPPADGILVRSLAWRPDGKVLAIGYSSGNLILCSTEDKEILYTNEAKGSVEILQWVSEKNNTLEEGASSNYQDDSPEFLPKLPSLSKTYSGTLGRRVEDKMDDAQKIGDQTRLNVLIVVTSSGRIYLYAFGIFPCLEYNLDETAIGKLKRVLEATISHDFGTLFLILEVENDAATGDSRLLSVSIQLPLLSMRRRELQFLAIKYGHLSSLLGYLSSTMRSITESWEDILLEIDAKLSNYAREKHRKGSGTVSDDFLELLMFGTPTDELHNFLLHELTEKGVKKLGHSIELSYSNIQKLVLKHLQNVGQALVYHLADLQGMSLWSERFGMLGLSRRRMDACLAVAGGFMLKATEIQQVIDNSMKNFKAFLRWLYVVILRLSDEPVPVEINKITQQDLQFVAEFLKENFAGDIREGDVERHSFNLELVGQYLKNDELHFPPDMSGNPWVAFLESHPALKEEALLFSYPYKASLVQQHNALQKELGDSLQDIAMHVGSTLVVQDIIVLADIVANSLPRINVQQLYVPADDSVYTLFAVPSAGNEYSVILQQFCGRHSSPSNVLRVNKVYFEQVGTGDSENKCHGHLVLDFKFYNEETVSVLLLENQPNGLPVLAQVPLANFLSPAVSSAVLEKTADGATHLQSADLMGRVNGGCGLVSGQYHRLDGVKGEQIAVSGTRHLACVLFVSRRRVRLFEMDVEDDEEESSLQPEDPENANTSRDESSTALGRTTNDITTNEEDKENVRSDCSV